MRSGRVVRHHVVDPWEEHGGVVVAVQPLVVAGELAEVGGGPDGGDGALPVAGERVCVIAEGLQGGVGYGCRVRDHIQVGEHGGVFEVAVGDSPMGVCGGNEAALDLGGEFVPPDMGSAIGGEEHPSHPRLTGVCSAENRRRLRHQLREVGGPLTQAGRQTTEGIKAAADESVHSHSVWARLVLGVL